MRAQQGGQWDKEETWEPRSSRFLSHPVHPDPVGPALLKLKVRSAVDTQPRPLGQRSLAEVPITPAGNSGDWAPLARPPRSHQRSLGLPPGWANGAGLGVGPGRGPEQRWRLSPFPRARRGPDPTQPRPAGFLLPRLAASSPHGSAPAAPLQDQPTEGLCVLRTT